MIKIKKDKKYTSTDKVCKLLQKSDKEFFENNAFTKRIIKEKTSVKIRSQSRKNVLEIKKKVCQRVNT